MSNILRIDTLDGTERVLRVNAPSLRRVSALGETLLRLLGLARIEAENAGPLLNGLLVVLRTEGGVGAAVVDLEAGAGAGVARVHVLDRLGPVLGGGLDVALGAGGVPAVDLVAGGHEAAGGDAGVGGCGLEHAGVGGGHDVLVGEIG